MLGTPAAVQSPAAMVQATGVTLSPDIDRVEQTTNRVRKCGEKVNFLIISLCAETSGRCYAFPSNPPYYFYNFATRKPLNTWRCPIVTSQSGMSSLLVGRHNIKIFTMRVVESEYVLFF